MDWNAISAEALAAISEVGAPAVLRRAGAQGGFDPDTGRNSEAASQDTPCTALLTNFALKLIDGTLIKQGDRLAIVPAQGLAVTPDPTRDKLLIKGEVWDIVRVGVVDPGGVALLYKLQVRQ